MTDSYAFATRLKIATMQQLPLRVRLRDSSRFASFIAGDGNRELCAQLASAADRGPRVMWLWGRKGCGKTHLLQAACAAVTERGGSAAYLDLATAPDRELLEGCEGLDLVCLDGLD